MVKYFYKDNKFIVEDYQNAKHFSSFLPAIAGKNGKPLWAFFASVGQCMGGFGIDDRNTPYTPFDSATLAYQNIPIKGFRTFLRINGKVYTPFFYSKGRQKLIIDKTYFSIIEDTSKYTIKITYSTVSNKDYPGLIRHVEIKSKVDGEIEICDGLPILFPKGLTNGVYKELVFLMSAYCQIDMGDNRPFVKFKTSTKDASEVEIAKEGNGYFTIDMNNERLSNIVELGVLFGNDTTLITAPNFIDGSYLSRVKEQQTENQLPCAFSYRKRTFKKGETYSFVTLFSSADSVEEFENNINPLTHDKLLDMMKETDDLVKSMLPKHIHTSNPIFDDYIVESVLDNNLRGGFPTVIGKDQIYYLYSRKHGDMERDYNFFSIPSSYYSSGPGNFRDVNQNRRNDLYFLNEIKDYNIYLFFSLIQADGQNPLSVKPLKFKYDGNDQLFKHADEVIRERLISLSKSYYPSEMYSLIKTNTSHIDIPYEEFFNKVINKSTQTVEACFGEGYWIDHWTYNVDLLENYKSIYPDKLEELLFRDDYKYFYSHVYVEPREEKYCLRSDGTVRQYGAVDLKNFKKENEKLGLTGQETLWLKDKNGQEVTTTLISKIFNLILIKFSTLDANQMGIEMECEKPGWNDAMNGLPGLFASAMSESIELLRLLRFFNNVARQFKGRKFEILKEQYDFFGKIYDSIRYIKPLEGKHRFKYWDNVTSAREALRKELRYNASGDTYAIAIDDDLLQLFDEMDSIVSDGIKRAKELGNGIIPSYIINEVSRYEKLNKVNYLGYETVRPLEFKTVLIPEFLEASARMAKLGQEFFDIETYQKIYKSDLRDQKLGLYKTCADIEHAPFEIGRVHAFTKGWLERECDFLHMGYKYLLGLLKAGLCEEFFRECKINLVCNMDVKVYGRNPIESSSFIVPTCNPNKALHGQGFLARLTGANAEVIDMFFNLVVGEKLFDVVDGELTFTLNPKLPAEYFDKNDIVTFELFNKVLVKYHNPKRLDCYKGVNLKYKIDGVEFDKVTGDIALRIRNKKVRRIEVEIY